VLLRVEAIRGLHIDNALGTKGSTVSGSSTSDAAVQTDNSLDIDESGLIGRCTSLLKRTDNTLDIETSVRNINDVPTASAHLRVHILSVGEVDGTIACDLVVIIDDGEVVQAEVSSQRDGFETNTLLQTGITDHTPGVVVHHVEPGAVVGCREVLGCHSESNGVCDTLTQGSSCDFDPLVFDLWVSGA
jgi:hypothetical protein